MIQSSFRMNNLHAIQRSRLARFGVSQCVDVHCHVLPGIDDGPKNLDESLTLCRSLMRDGITTVIATPHQLGRYDGHNSAAQVRQRVAELQGILDEKKIPLTILSGGEVRIDERIGKLLHEDHILTLGDGKKYLLLELPSSVAIDPAVLMPRLKDANVTVILAHAERYDNLQTEPNCARAWVDAGAVLQVNAGAPVGAFGKSAARAAWDWLSRGWVSLIATDAHSVDTRRPRFTDAIEAIAQKLGEDVARCVCIENPIRVAEGKELQEPKSAV
jgi:protein-tyrosine phosphatase